MLNRRNILFLTPEFYNYPILIKSTLESMGATVSLFYNRPTDILGKYTKLFAEQKYEIIKQKYFERLIGKTGAFYDYVLIIRADLIPLDFLIQIRKKNPGAIFIQYLWDDINLFPKLKDSFIFFDRILSYNLLDCKEHGLVFRPFFFIKLQDFTKQNNSHKSRLYFIGSYHSDRLSIIEKIQKLNPQIKFNFYLYINPITFLLSRLPLRKLPYFKFRKMRYSCMLNEIEKSAAILDIQNTSQIGLTTRVFEALGAGTKVVTVNENILEYDFCNNENILLIDRLNPEIQEEWLNIPFKQYDNSLLEKYHIKNWVKDVFGSSKQEV